MLRTPNISRITSNLFAGLRGLASPVIVGVASTLNLQVGGSHDEMYGQRYIVFNSGVIRLSPGWRKPCCIAGDLGSSEVA